jgi:hypothetical protein
MDDIYPSMNIAPFSSPIEIYVYGSVVLGIIATLTLFCVKEPQRVYRIIKRKNTDENPVIQI